VVGRIGVHSPKDEKGLGSNAENILRAAPCDVLLSTRLEVPRLDVRAEETVRWTPEAEERMKHVPEQVKGIARTGVLRLALEKGHSVITSAVIDDAMDRFMPKSASGDQGAGRGRGARASEERARVDVPGVRRRGHAERRREVHRLRRHGFRGDLPRR
jgi:hypothetical protein